MTRLRLSAAIAVLLVASLMLGISIYSGAGAVAKKYRWTSATLFVEGGTTANVGACNLTGKVQAVTLRMVPSGGGTPYVNATVNLGAGQCGGQSTDPAIDSVRLEVIASTELVLPRGSFVPDGGTAPQTLSPGDFMEYGQPGGGLHTRLNKVEKQVGQILKIVKKINKKT